MFHLRSYSCGFGVWVPSCWRTIPGWMRSRCFGAGYRNRPGSLATGSIVEAPLLEARWGGTFHVSQNAHGSDRDGAPRESARDHAGE